MESAGVAESVHERNHGADDEDIAARCAATILISAWAARDVERVARRIHAASARAASSFVQVPAGALPMEPGVLTETCARLAEAAAGGTLLFTDVEAMPAIVQDRIMETLAGVKGARNPLVSVRLMAGTTVSLADCIASGRFSERLFYRLNVIHIIAGAPLAEKHR